MDVPFGISIVIQSILVWSVSFGLLALRMRVGPVHNTAFRFSLCGCLGMSSSLLQSLSECRQLVLECLLISLRSQEGIFPEMISIDLLGRPSIRLSSASHNALPNISQVV